MSSGLALAAALLTFALWNAPLLNHLQAVFLILRDAPGTPVNRPGFLIATLLISATSLAAAFVVQRLGARKAFPYLGSAFLACAIVSLLSSWFLSLDILFVPIAITAAVSTATVQIYRLCCRDSDITQKLVESASKLGSPNALAAHSRLISGLTLLDTVLSPKEAIVFQVDNEGNLSASARLRASDDGAVEGCRNSIWREGVRLCERAMQLNRLITVGPGNGMYTSIALPLRHESRTVGALLIRLADEFDDSDRALLSAVGSQMARNLQREEACKAVQKRKGLAYFSTRAAEQRFESLYVLNGLLTEQRFGVNVLAEISDGVAIAYLDGTLAYVNKSLLNFAQLKEEEAQTLNLFTLLDRLRTDVFDEPAIAVRRVLQTGEAYERELHFTERNETLGMRLSLVLDQGNSREPLCLAIHIKELTRLKQYERLKSDMISLMSHELRTPLTSINGFAELLTTDTELPEQAKEFVAIIASESQRLSKMINTFLAVTQLERKDKQEVLKIPLRLDEVVRETISRLQPVAKKRRIRLVEQPSQRIPPVAADKSLITQAVKNLVDNAIKYSPERTTVTVSTALEAEAVRVCVEDRGYGIPAEAKDRVWEKFYRVVREGQEKDEDSTGLGLSFVREIVEQHGGTVELESEEGRGSKFSFTLPRL
ncbi:MAG TPA: GAF domain-containing sensor histidine kinase [Pyrinomonadaceae bacterium]|nr:GAF domain-containing sensor histidine kinase [Pyrinomonadaceae bacterium]